MKTLILSLVMLAGLSAFAQQPTFKTYVEYTNMGGKFGNAVGYTFQNNFQLGGFYQSAVGQQNDGEGFEYRVHEETFAGAYVGLPVKPKGAFVCDVIVRTGVVNGEFFTITPSLVTSLKPSKMFQFNMGVGVRAFRPTLQAGLTVRLNNH